MKVVNDEGETVIDVTNVESGEGIERCTILCITTKV